MTGSIFLVGPTAVGKSALAVDLAEKLGAEILNADAFQLYRGLDVLTAKPDAAVQQRVKHHLLSFVEVNEVMSAVKFRTLALQALNQIRDRGKIAIVVSGSGLYVRALLRGFDNVPPPDETLRKKLSKLSLEELTQELRQLNSDVASRTDLKNPRRVMRAIEIAVSKGHVTSSGSAPDTELEKNRGIFLVRDRDDMYARINRRVEAMLGEGVEQEVATLRDAGPTAAQALGLREIRQLLAGEVSREDCIAKIQQATRRYAKRQLTWFRHQTNFLQLNLTALSHQQAISAIMRVIARR